MVRPQLRALARLLLLLLLLLASLGMVVGAGTVDPPPGATGPRGAPHHVEVAIAPERLLATTAERPWRATGAPVPLPAVVGAMTTGAGASALLLLRVVEAAVRRRRGAGAAGVRWRARLEGAPPAPC